MYLLDLSVQAYDRAFDTTMHTGVRPRIGRDVPHRCATAHWTRCSAQVCDRTLDAMFRTGVRSRVGRDVPHRCATAHWTRCSAQVCDRALDAMFRTGVRPRIGRDFRTGVRPRVGRDEPHMCATALWTRCTAQVCLCASSSTIYYLLCMWRYAYVTYLLLGVMCLQVASYTLHGCAKTFTCWGHVTVG